MFFLPLLGRRVNVSVCVSLGFPCHAKNQKTVEIWSSTGAKGGSFGTIRIWEVVTKDL